MTTSAVPGGLRWLIPPGLTFLTGLVFLLPVIYGAGHPTFVRERAELRIEASVS